MVAAVASKLALYVACGYSAAGPQCRCSYLRRQPILIIPAVIFKMTLYERSQACRYLPGHALFGFAVTSVTPEQVMKRMPARGRQSRVTYTSGKGPWPPAQLNQGPQDRRDQGQQAVSQGTANGAVRHNEPGDSS